MASVSAVDHDRGIVHATMDMRTSSVCDCVLFFLCRIRPWEDEIRATASSDSFVALGNHHRHGAVLKELYVPLC